MEKSARMATPALCAIVIFLGLLALSCCVAAEYKKAKEEDMKLDGNLCSIPRTPAFGLGVTALVCLSIAQIVGTSAISIRLRSQEKKQGVSTAERRPTAPAITLLAISWVTFALATVLLGAGSSMNKGQPYGQGWTDGKCYVVRGGVYLSSAALVAVTVTLAAVMVLLSSSTGPASVPRRRTGPDGLHLSK